MKIRGDAVLRPGDAFWVCEGDGPPARRVYTGPVRETFFNSLFVGSDAEGVVYSPEFCFASEEAAERNWLEGLEFRVEFHRRQADLLSAERDQWLSLRGR